MIMRRFEGGGADGAACGGGKGRSTGPERAVTWCCIGGGALCIATVPANASGEVGGADEG